MGSSAPAAAASSCPAPKPARCFVFTVPLDHSRKVDGRIVIRAARMRARHAVRPPIIGLTGGPGQAGVMYASTYDYLLPRAGRDLYVLDQRGTGASGLLRCPSLEGNITTSFTSAAGACGRRLGTRRSYYTSADSADDLESLRVYLGVPRIALYAISYGTRVAEEYARRYPKHLERVILDSPIGIGAPDALARETLGAVGRVLRTVCRPGCGGAQAHPVADVARLVPRLRRSPIRRIVRRNGRRVSVRVGADDLLGMIVSGDLNPSFMRRIPPAVRAAVGGNVGPLVRLKLGVYEPGPGDDERVSEFSPAVYAATTCEESTFAWDPTADSATRRKQARDALAATPASAFAPFDRDAGLNFGLLSLCGDWPAPERVVAPARPLPKTVPALVLSGNLDLRTPLENARRLATALGGKLVVAQGVGHSVLGSQNGGCAEAAVDAFLARRPLPGCDRNALIGIERSARRAAAPRLPF